MYYHVCFYKTGLSGRRDVRICERMDFMSLDDAIEAIDARFGEKVAGWCIQDLTENVTDIAKLKNVLRKALESTRQYVIAELKEDNPDCIKYSGYEFLFTVRDEKMFPPVLGITVVQNSNGDVRHAKKKSLSEIMGYNLYVPPHQCGFGWRADEMMKMIQILDNVLLKNSAINSLQLPAIVIRPCDKGMAKDLGGRFGRDGAKWREVLGGQCELTTLRLLLEIYYYFCPDVERKSYHLDYATNSALGKALDSVKIVADSGTLRFEMPGLAEDDHDGQALQACGNFLLEYFSQHRDRVGTILAGLMNPLSAGSCVKVALLSAADRK